MDDSEEGEICRVCRCEGTDAEPLFYPCKCSGSIKYVHQSCLSQWLAHSRKNYCELCKHPFSFTPIYSESMPEAIPVHVFLHRGTLSLARGILFVSRCVVIALFWLIVLPYTVLSTFRVMINLTDKGAKIVSYGFQPEGVNFLLDSSDASDHYQLYLKYLETFQLVTKPAVENVNSWNEFWSDCFKGQVTTVGIVSVFLILFLLREWAFHAFPQLNTGAPLPGENPTDRQPPRAPSVPIPPLRNSAQLRNVPLIIAPMRFDSDEHRRAIRQRILRSRQPTQNSTRSESSQSSSRHSIGSRNFLSSLNTLQSDAPIQVAKSLEEINEKYGLVIPEDSPQQNSELDESAFNDNLSSTNLQTADVSSSLLNAEQSSSSQISSRAPNTTGFTSFLNNSEVDIQVSNSFQISSSSNSNEHHATTLDNSSPLPTTTLSNLETTPVDLNSPQLPSSSTDAVLLANNDIFSELESEAFAPKQSDLFSPKELVDQREAIKKLTDSLEKFAVEQSSSQIEDTTASVSFERFPSRTLVSEQQVGSSSQHNSLGNIKENTSPELPSTLSDDLLLNSESNSNRTISNGALIFPTGTSEPSSSLNPLPQTSNIDSPQLFNEQTMAYDDLPQIDEIATPRVEDIEQDVQAEPVEDQPAPAPIEEEAAEAEDGEDILEDFNGVAEFLGIRGDPLVLVQYSLMIFIMVTAGLWGFIGLPYLMGRFIMLLEFTTVIKLPLISFRYLLRGVRLVTDPCTHFVIHNVVAKIFGPSEVTGVQASMGLLNGFLDNIFIKVGELPAQLTQLFSSPVSEELAIVGPQYSWGWAMYDRYDSLRLITATSDRATDRIITVMVGYSMIGLGYLACIKLGDITSPELVSVRRIIYVMVKIAVFILLEILVFPFLCGVLLDYVTLPLFNSASVETRLKLFSNAPMSIIFLHWFFGTVFFFLFSMFMTLCRKASRRGLLWFIRDPNEANPQPVREIISRSVKDQVYRLSVSALVYAIIICGGVGAVVYSGRLLPGKVLPLRLHFGRAFHEVSFDLFFLELLIPVLISHFKPHNRFKEVFISMWRKVASWFRLSSFLTGQRSISEEYSGLPRTWSAGFRIHRPISHPDYIFIADGGFRRTPNSDTVTIVPGRRMVVPCRRDGRPINPVDIPSDSPIYSNTNISVVYTPPNFGLRIAAFIFTIASICNMIGWTLLFIPLITGRFITSLIFPDQSKISDIYSYNLGLFLNGIVLFSVLKIFHEFREAKTLATSGGLSIYFARIQQRLFKTLKQIYIISGVWAISPILMALLIDMYVHTPFQSTGSTPLFKSPFRASYMWTVGASLLLVAKRHADKYPEGLVAKNLPQQLISIDLADPHPLAFSKGFLFPFIGISSLLYAIPLLAALYCSAKLIIPTEVFIQWYSRICLSLLILSGILKHTESYIRRWRRSIRDEEYLVGQALNNIRRTQPTPETN